VVESISPSLHRLPSYMIIYAPSLPRLWLLYKDTLLVIETAQQTRLTRLGNHTTTLTPSAGVTGPIPSSIDVDRDGRIMTRSQFRTQRRSHINQSVSCLIEIDAGCRNLCRLRYGPSIRLLAKCTVRDLEPKGQNQDEPRQNVNCLNTMH
jgi:hypothetical protein